MTSDIDIPAPATQTKVNEVRSEPRLTDVIAGVLTDCQKLATQQFALLRAEVRSDWDNVKSAIRPIIMGAVFSFVGFLLLGSMAALVIHWSLNPTEVVPERMPLWACFGIVAAAFIGLGAAFLYSGIKSLRAVNPLPDETMAALEQNFDKLVNRTTAAGL